MTKPTPISLEKIIELLTGEFIAIAEDVPDFYTVFQDYLKADAASYWQNSIGKRLFINIFNRHFDDIIFVCEDGTPTPEEIRDFVFRFYAVLSHYKARYDKLVEVYESQANNLLKGIKRETHTGTAANDTPQNYNIEDYLSDGFATAATLSHATEESDTADVIDKLTKIKNNYVDIMHEYAKKFDSLFVSSLNF